jgi:hypothetical protein
MRVELSYKVVGLILLSLIVFFPTYLFGDSASKGQVFLFLSFPLVLFFTWLAKSALSGNYNISYPFIAYAIFAVFVTTFFTIVSKVSFLNASLLVNHFRYLAYLVVFVLSFSLALKMRITVKDLEWILFRVSFLAFLFIVLQLIVPNSFPVKVVSQKPALDYLGFRIGGPFEWSYIFCFCMITTLFMGMHQFFRKEGQQRNYVITGLILITYLLSQSKAAYISLFVFLFFLVVYSLISYKKNTRIFIAISIGFLISTGILIVFWDMFSHIIGFVEKASSGHLDSSTTTRLKQFSFAKYTLENNFFLGYPIKYLVIENAYVHYFYNYGVLGLSSYITLFLAFFFDALLRLKKASKANFGMNIGLHLGIVCLVGSIFIFGLGASPTDANKASYFFYFIYGAYIASTVNYQKITGHPST